MEQMYVCVCACVFVCVHVRAIVCELVCVYECAYLPVLAFFFSLVYLHSFFLRVKRLFYFLLFGFLLGDDLSIRRRQSGSDGSGLSGLRGRR